MTLLEKVFFLCVDCEFTGLDPEKDRIVEVAAVRFTFHQMLDHFETLIDPECPISKEACDIHHITLEMLKGKPKIEQILPTLLNFLKEGYFVGHGIGYDLEMIYRAAKRSGLDAEFLKEKPLIDTLRLARHYGDSPNNSLEMLAQHFNVPTEGAHRAMNDVAMNVEVFKHLVRRYKTLEQVLDILARPIKMKYMPLGKYKGRMFSEIPLQYLYKASHMDYDQDLLYSIKLELNKRHKGDSFSVKTNPFSEL